VGEVKQRRAVGSYALKVLRGAERDKRELLSSFAADSSSSSSSFEEEK